MDCQPAITCMLAIPLDNSIMTDYIGGWTLEHLERAFSKLAPTCEYCHGKCTFICIEQCCVGSGLFCIDCDREHWLHRKN